MQGVRERSTASRLKAACDYVIPQRENIEAVVSARNVLLRSVLEQQLLDAARGVTVSNAVEITHLSTSQRKELRDALMAIHLLPLLLR
jgi:signal-transduction protein with cAMP-binding, CBS, and nucleotidyltransferase domain